MHHPAVCPLLQAQSKGTEHNKHGSAALAKLQQENAALRSKLTEMTASATSASVRF